MKIIYTTIVLSFLSISLLAQTDLDDQNDDKVFYEEYFQNNENNWKIYYKKILFGRYFIETIGRDAPAISTKTFFFNEKLNYEIETKVAIEWNKSKEMMGFLWNADSTSAYGIAFNKELKPYVFTTDNGKETIVKMGSEENMLQDMYEENTLTVKKIDYEYLVFINGKYFCTMPTTKNLRKQIGYFIGKKSEMKVESLILKYL